jgi:ABC-type multidrug transport system ATPase subunit
VSMGLAPKAVDEVFAFIGRLASESVAVLIVEQYVARALDLASYAYVLGNGAVRFEGPAGEISRSEIAQSYLHTASDDRNVTEMTSTIDTTHRAGIETERADEKSRTATAADAESTDQVDTPKEKQRWPVTNRR